MVERGMNLDLLFHSLADPTRRDMLLRLCREQLSVSELAGKYAMSFAAVAKHLKVLESAKLITKTRHGKQQVAAARPEAITLASEHLRRYEQLWSERFANLENLLNEEKNNE